MFNIFKKKKTVEEQLEAARNKLIADLDKGDLNFLLEKMADEGIYSPLLEEQRKTSSSGSDYISGYAYDRARRLNSPAEKEQLLKKLENETNPSLRKHLYFCLGHLCTNTTDGELFNFLMGELESEKDKDCREIILIVVKDMKKANGLNIEPLKRLAQKTGAHRLDALMALNHTNDKEVEDIVLDAFESYKDSLKKDLICRTLENVGTLKSIPILQSEYKRTRDYSLRNSITNAIDKIEQRQKATSK